jgi:serine/threonine-protein kinase RsbW
VTRTPHLDERPSGEVGLAGPVGLVELSIPARPDLLSIPRMAIAAIATDVGFDIEQVDDIRLAIEEICLSTGVGRGEGRLRLRYEWHDDSLEASCVFEAEEHGRAPTARNEQASDLSERLLEALVDEHGIESGPPGTRAWFRKVRSSTSAE